MINPADFQIPSDKSENFYNGGMLNTKTLSSVKNYNKNYFGLQDDFFGINEPLKNNRIISKNINKARNSSVRRHLPNLPGKVDSLSQTADDYDAYPKQFQTLNFEKSNNNIVSDFSKVI